jgi:hypothetical protein
MKAIHLSLSLIVMVACLSPAQDKRIEDKPVQNVTIADLGFMAGHSQGELDGGISDEHWSEPAGDSMMGVYRYIQDGKVQMYEFMSIEQTSQGPVLRLKHFHPGLVGWEEKEQVWNYPLKSWKPGAAVFEAADKSTRISYRVTGKDGLEATLDRTGKPTEVFQFKHTAN